MKEIEDYKELIDFIDSELELFKHKMDFYSIGKRAAFEMVKHKIKKLCKK